ncbi:T-cell surface glycoprotein CD3 epsilon chain [Pseudophryne corroboree]|uniref:T-cell surface glycoprotein CD3 epsilon chain n=1 Tax=Pseudophryne corroboree TaxID=495146 RepID=UPI003081AD57
MKPRILQSILVAGLFFDLLSAEDDQSAPSYHNHKFKVHITGLSVMITCPKEGETTLKKDNVAKSSNKEEHGLYSYSSSDNGLYNCENKYLYLHAYVCETCTDVSIIMVAVILIADGLVTIGVSFIIYFGCRRKSGRTREGGFGNGGHKKGRKEVPPPVPNPDYEPIQRGRRELYDGLNQPFK